MNGLKAGRHRQAGCEKERREMMKLRRMWMLLSRCGKQVLNTRTIMSSYTGASRLWFAVVVAVALALGAGQQAAAQTEVQASGPDSPIPPRLIYAVTPEGQMLLYVDNSSDSTLTWIAAAVQPPVVPAGAVQLAWGGEDSVDVEYGV